LKKTNSPDTGQHRTPVDFCRWDGDNLILNILGTPGAKLNTIGKIKGHQLKVSVTTSPEDGKATDSMIRFLAKEFEVSVKDIEVIYGQFNINKQLRIRKPKKLPAVIAEHLAKQG
jgi:uncharacterized protein